MKYYKFSCDIDGDVRVRQYGSIKDALHDIKVNGEHLESSIDISDPQYWPENHVILIRGELIQP